MDKLTKEEVDHIAHLARIGMSDSERETFQVELKKLLDEVKKITHKDMITILKEIDQEFLYKTINREQFKKYFFENAEDGEIKEYIAKILK